LLQTFVNLGHKKFIALGPGINAINFLSSASTLRHNKLECTIHWQMLGKAKGKEKYFKTSAIIVNVIKLFFFVTHDKAK
jgi:hypothetical protein